MPPDTDRSSPSHINSPRIPSLTQATQRVKTWATQCESGLASIGHRYAVLSPGHRRNVSSYIMHIVIDTVGLVWLLYLLLNAWCMCGDFWMHARVSKGPYIGNTMLWAVHGVLRRHARPAIPKRSDMHVNSHPCACVCVCVQSFQINLTLLVSIYLLEMVWRPGRLCVFMS